MWPWPLVYVTQCNIILKVFIHATFSPSLITLLWIESEILSKIDIFQIFSKYCDLDQVKVTQGHIILKVSPQATFGPSLIT